MQADNLGDHVNNGVSELPETLTRWDRGGDLGGRIMRDKLWFYGAGRKRLDTAELLGAFLEDGLPSLGQTDKTWFVGKLTGQLTPSQKLITSYQWEGRTNTRGPRNRREDPRTRSKFTLYGHVGKGEYQLVKNQTFLSVVAGAWVSTGPCGLN